MVVADFSSLEGIFEMFTPSDLVGKVQPDLGGPLSQVDNVFTQLLAILENSGRGVLSVDSIVKRLQELKAKAPVDGGVDLSRYLSVYAGKQVIDLGPGSSAAAIYVGKDGAARVGGLADVVGKDYVAAASEASFNASVILSKSPFFNPATRNTKRAQVFMNSMPSVVLSQLVPHMQVEFQFTRDPSDRLQALGQLKLLLGAARKGQLSEADAAIVEAHQVDVQDAGGRRELDFAGMEVFTSPQTLTNPLPNASAGTMGDRYVNVLDPFRPFATLEHVSISSKPSGAGFYCYKKANLSIKVHDRSRLNEISDLLRPRVYTGVTIWMTYGWRAPSRGDANPYFKYVNDNMMMREAYHIVNSSFAFDNLGQVTINLELFTKGVPELRELKVTDNRLDMSFRTQQLQRLTEMVSNYRRILRLDPPEGISKEIRAFQVLDAAEVGEFPDMTAGEVTRQIDALERSLVRTAGIDREALSGLIGSMRELYAPDKRDPKKFDFKERYNTRLTSVLEAMFFEVRSGPDPFLPGPGKDLGEEVTAIVGRLNRQPETSVSHVSRTVVSFGKLFSVFALRAIMSVPDAADEVQVIFYNLNDQCGPISNHSIAEFPINMPMFLDQFREFVVSNGGEKITLEDFLALVINAQFLDNRALGYGLSTYYEPYARGREAQVKHDMQGNFESALASMTARYGPFRKPVVEMYVESTHERPDEAGDSDILQQLGYSARDARAISIRDSQGNAARRIMRIHVYDKQTNAHRAARALLRNVNNTGFINVNPGIDDRFRQYSPKPEDTFESFRRAVGASLQEDVARGAVQITDMGAFSSNQQIKDVVSKLVPTIVFGSNGTTVTTANLASKADPLLSTVQMIRSQTVRNNANPNGSGDMGIPLRVIPAQMNMMSLGNPLATMAQQYFIDFQTGTTLDNLYIVTGHNHTFSPGKFETQWTFGYSDAYGVFEGAPNIVQQIALLRGDVPKDPAA